MANVGGRTCLLTEAVVTDIGRPTYTLVTERVHHTLASVFTRVRVAGDLSCWLTYVDVRAGNKCLYNELIGVNYKAVYVILFRREKRLQRDRRRGYSIG